MSIATLKRKTQAKYNNSSVGQKQFSLNGTHRSQGYVGQTMLSRHFPASLMKGDVIRGHGGCCGQYPIKTIVQSGVTSQEDSTVVKSSVINNLGMITNKYDCIGSCILGQEDDAGCSKRVNIVKPDNNRNNNSQQTYIANVAKKSIQDTNTCNANYKLYKDSMYLHRYVKWYISDLANFSLADCVQVSEFALQFNGVNIDWPEGTTVIASGENTGEEATYLIDYNTNTKWLDFNIMIVGNEYSYVIFDLQTPVNFNGYNWATAADASTFPYRNPASWTLSVSNDGSNWTIVDTQVGFDSSQTPNAEFNPRPFTFELPSVKPVTVCDPVLGIKSSRRYKGLITKSDEECKIPITYDKYLLQLDNRCISNNVRNISSISYQPLPSH